MILRAYQWKMSSNPDKSKQAQEVIFSRKTQRVIHPPAIFNNMPVVRSSCQKHLVIYLDEKLNFSNHIKENISKANKGIGILKKLYNGLPRNSLILLLCYEIKHCDHIFFSKFGHRPLFNDTHYKTILVWVLASIWLTNTTQCL